MKIKVTGAAVEMTVHDLPVGSVFRADGDCYLVISRAELNGCNDEVLYAISLDGRNWWLEGSWLVSPDEVFTVDEISLSRGVK